MGPTGLAESLNEPKEFTRSIASVIAFKSDEERLAMVENEYPQQFSEDQVGQFLYKFHRAYPEIQSFQQRIEEDLITNKGTYNLFGRKCLVGCLSHLSETRAYVKFKDNWYLMHFFCTAMSQDALNILPTRISRIKLLTPLPFKVDKTKWEFGELLDVFRLHADPQDLLKEDGRSTNREDLRQIFNDSTLIASSPIFSMWNPGKAPSSELSEAPFMSLKHSLIHLIFHSFRPKQRLVYYGFDKMRREMISYRIQSSSMDITRIAMIEFRKWAAKDGLMITFAQDW